MRAGILILALLLPATGFPQAPSDAESREILSYKLTEAGLARYQAAMRNLSGPAIRGDDTEVQTFDQTVAKLDASPGAKAAIQSAGMTTREFILFAWSVALNGVATSAAAEPGGELPPGVMQANVNFYRQHEAALLQIAEDTDTSSCD